MDIFNEGIGDFSDSGKPPKQQIERAKKWIERFGLPLKGINFHFKSYSLKHCVERWWQSEHPGTAYYVSNGAFIQAALDLGYRVHPVGDKGDACFNMRMPPKWTDERAEAGFRDLPAPRKFF